MKKELHKMLAKIGAGTQVDPLLLFPLLQIAGYLDKDEVHNIKMAETVTDRLSRMFGFLEAKDEDVLIHLQKISFEKKWPDLLELVQNELLEAGKTDLLYGPALPKNMSVISNVPDKNAPGQETKVVTPEDYYSRELRLFQNVDQTKGIIKKFHIEQMDGKNVEELENRMIPSLNIYENFSKPRGLALILNNREFDYMAERTGTDIDAENMKKLLKELSYNVKTEENLTADEMLEAVEQFANRKEHSKYHSTIVVILSHGDRDVLYGRDGRFVGGKSVSGAVEVEKIVGCLNDCKALHNKPKIFIFQACRGQTRDLGKELSDGPPEEVIAKLNEADSKAIKIPTGSDVLIAYSTTPGYVSWRNTETGSWFIEAICTIFQKKAKDSDILKLFTQVNNVVSTKMHLTKGYVQMSQAVSTLRKEFYFFPGYVTEPNAVSLKSLTLY